MTPRAEAPRCRECGRNARQVGELIAIPVYDPSKCTETGRKDLPPYYLCAEHAQSLPWVKEYPL